MRAMRAMLPIALPSLTVSFEATCSISRYVPLRYAAAARSSSVGTFHHAMWTPFQPVAGDSMLLSLPLEAKATRHDAKRSHAMRCKCKCTP